jgi:hypothetical protein
MPITFTVPYRKAKMAKLRLDPESLRVESFELAGDGTSHGTVFGNASYPAGCNPETGSADPEYDTCAFATCAGATCYASCNGSCDCGTVGCGDTVNTCPLVSVCFGHCPPDP